MCLPFLPPTIDPPDFRTEARYGLAVMDFQSAFKASFRHRPSWRVPDTDFRAERKARRWWHLSQLREAFFNFFNR